ncbi:MAG: hypothetical protein F6K42_00605 [Leptolyngbya sp. SIO1D8]|nr:hypothetical protein [Leptolyngbya sp. SIO1D8]
MRELQQLQRQHEALRQELVEGLPSVFNITVDDVIDFNIDPETGFQSGTLMSGGKTYTYELGAGVKKLELVEIS